MKNLIIFILLFIIVYLFYLFFLIKRKKELKKFEKGKEFTYLKIVYKLDYSKINIKSLANAIALANSFILASTAMIISFFDKFIISMLVGFLMLIPLILIVYHIVGLIYKKKKSGGKK